MFRYVGVSDFARGVVGQGAPAVQRNWESSCEHRSQGTVPERGRREEKPRRQVQHFFSTCQECTTRDLSLHPHEKPLASHFRCLMDHSCLTTELGFRRSLTQFFIAPHGSLTRGWRWPAGLEPFPWVTSYIWSNSSDSLRRFCVTLWDLSRWLSCDVGTVLVGYIPKAQRHHLAAGR